MGLNYEMIEKKDPGLKKQSDLNLTLKTNSNIDINDRLDVFEAIKNKKRIKPKSSFNWICRSSMDNILLWWLTTRL